MMKKLYALVFFLTMVYSGYAQVGIGTPMPDNSAQLDIVAQDKGILIPRVALTGTKDVMTIASGNVESLLVFNTATAGDIKPGYYYWLDNSWHRVVTPQDISGGNVVDNIVVYNPVTNQFNYINEAGDQVTIGFEDLVREAETVTRLTENADGTYTYYNEAALDEAGNPVPGSGVVIDIPSSVVNQFEEIINNEEVRNELFETINNSYIGGNVYYDGDTFTYVTETGENREVTIREIVEANETVTTLVDNGDGTFTYYNEEDYDAEGNLKPGATGTLFDANTGNFTDNGDGTYTFINKNGDTVTVNPVQEVADNIVNQGDIYNEIVNILNAGSDILVDNGNGTYTHTSVDGTVTTIDANTTSVTEVDGVYTFTDAAGNTITTIDTNAGASGYDNTTSGLASNNVQDAIDELVNHINNGAGVELVDNGDGTVSLTAEDGTVLGTVDKSSLTDNGDGTYTFDSGNGSPVTIDTNADALAFDNSSNGFTSDNVQDALEELKTQLDGTTDELVDNGNGTFTHTAVDGTVVTFDSNTTTVNVVDGVYTFLDGDNQVITSIDTNADAITYDNSSSGLTAGDVQDAIDELVNHINNGAGVELVDNGNGTVSLTADDGTVLGTVDKSSLTDNGDGTYTFDSGNGSPVTIDVPASVVNQFDEIVNGGPVVVNGDTYNSVEEYLEQFVATNETVTNIVDNGNGTFTYTNENGDDVIFDANTTTLADNGNGTYTFTNANGDTLTIDTNADALAFDNSSNGFTSDNVQDALEELKTQLDGTTDELVDNGDGTFTHTAVDGTVVTFDSNTTTVNVVDGVYTFLDGDNQVITSIDTNADAITYDNSTSGLTAGDVQDAIDELSNILANTTDILVDNGDGTFTHTAVDGTEVTFDSNTTTVNVVDGVYTFLDGDNQVITSIDTNADAITYDNSTSGLTAGDVQDAIDEIVNHINNGGGVELVDNGDGTVSLTADDGTVLGTVDKSSLTDNGDGTYTFDSGNGSPVTIDTNADALAFDNSSNGFTSDNVQGALEELKTQLDGTTDELVDNGDGTFTHTAVDGTVVTFDSNTTTVNVVDGVYTYLDGDNQVITSIDTNADAITYDNSTSGLTAGDVQDAIDEIVNHINNGGGVELVDNGDGTVSLTADDGTVLGTVDKSSLTDNGDGTYTFDSGNGSPVTIDTNADALAFDNSSNGFTSDNVQDALEELKTQLDGTTDELVDNGNGTYTHTSVDGTVTTIDANTTSVTELDGVYTFTDAAGNTITTIDTNAGASGYDNTNSGLASNNVQDAIDELVTNINNGAGVELVDNGDGTVSLTAEDGTVLGTVDKSSLTDNGDGTYTFDSGNGSPVTIDIPASVVNQFDEIVNGGPVEVNGDTYTTVEEYLQYVVNSNETLTELSYDENTNQLNFKDEAGTTHNIQLNNTNLSYDETAQELVYVDSEGNTSTIGLNNLVNSNINTGDLLTHADERISIVDGADALLHDVRIDVNEANLRLQNIGGTLQVSQIQNGTPNQILVTNVGGNGVTWADPVAIAEGSLTSDDIEVTNGNNAIFKDVALEIKEGAVAPEKLSADPVDEGKVGVVQNDGTVVYQNISSENVDGEDLSVSGGLEFTGGTDGTGKLLAEAGIGVADGGIITDKLANDAVTNEKLADNAVATENIVDGTIATADLADDAITTDKIADNAVTAATINSDVAGDGLVQDVNGALAVDPAAVAALADGDITSTDLVVTGGDDAAFKDVTLAIADGAVTTTKLADDAVTTDKIADGAVTNDKVGADAITSDKILDGEVNTADLAGDAVTNDKVADNAIQTENIVDGAVAPEKLSADPVDEGKVGVVQNDGTVVYQNISSENVDGEDLSVSGGLEFTGGTDGTGKLLAEAGIGVADGGITTDKLAADAVTNEKLADNAVQMENIVDGAVTNDKVGADAITTDKIQNGEVKAEDLGADAADEGKVGVVQADGTVVYQNISSENVDGEDLSVSGGLEFTGGTDGTGKLLAEAGIGVADGGITTDKLAADAVTNEKLADNAVATENIVDGTIATADLADDAITTDKIADNAVTAATINSDVAGDGLVQDTNGALAVDPAAVAALADGDITSTDLVVTGGDDAAFKDVTLAIADGAVTTTKLADDAVTTAKIANGAVTNDKVGADAITSDKILDGEVNTADLADDAVTNDKVADNAIQTENIVDGAVAPEKLSADPVDEGKVGVVQADGTVVYQNISSENVDGEDLSVSGGLEFTGGTDGTGKLLAEAGIGVADGGIITDKLANDAVTNEKLADNAVQTENIIDGTIATIDLADGAVTPAKMNPGAADQVMITNNAGDVEWVDRSEFEVNLNDGNVTVVSGDGTQVNPYVIDVDVNNGLSVVDENIQLGGALTDPTTITADAANTLAIAGLQTGAGTDNVVVADPASGVLKQVKAVMPKFFYMPSVVFDVSSTGAGFTRDLHQEYTEQFGSPVVSSTGATNGIPTLTDTELEYYVTYYDTNVFGNVTIDADGTLHYDIIGTSPTAASFMNIVFVVK